MRDAKIDACRIEKKRRHWQSGIPPSIEAPCQPLLAANTGRLGQAASKLR